MNVIHHHIPRVLLAYAVDPLFETPRILRCPPVAQVALGVELATLVVERIGSPVRPSYNAHTWRVTLAAGPSQPRNAGHMSPHARRYRMDVNDQLHALEEALLTPALRGDRRRLTTLLAEEFREFGSSGRIFTKAEILIHLQNETPAGRTLTDFQATPVAPGAVLVTYRLQRDLAQADTLEISAEASHSLRSSLWVQCEGHWQLLFHQGTPAASAAHPES